MISQTHGTAYTPSSALTERSYRAKNYVLIFMINICVFVNLTGKLVATGIFLYFVVLSPMRSPCSISPENPIALVIMNRFSVCIVYWHLDANIVRKFNGTVHDKRFIFTLIPRRIVQQRTGK